MPAQPPPRHGATHRVQVSPPAAEARPAEATPQAPNGGTGAPQPPAPAAAAPEPTSPCVGRAAAHGGRGARSGSRWPPSPLRTRRAPHPGRSPPDSSGAPHGGITPHGRGRASRELTPRRRLPRPGAGSEGRLYLGEGFRGVSHPQTCRGATQESGSSSALPLMERGSWLSWLSNVIKKP